MRLLEYPEQEERVRLKLEGQMLPGLFERLLTMKGRQLQSTYQIHSLFDVGGQGILYLATDMRHDSYPVLIKLPFLPYHQPGRLDIAQIEKARTALLWETYVLAGFSGTIFPELYDMVEAPNPLHHQAWGELVDREPFLVMEWIQGHSLEQELAIRHQTIPDPVQLENLAWHLTGELLTLFQSMWQQRKFLYTDLRPQNILLADRTRDGRYQPEWRRCYHRASCEFEPPKVDTAVRLIDAGSVVRDVASSSFVPYHPSYAPPSFSRAGVIVESAVPTPSFVLYTLGKTLVQLFTNREPLPSQDPNWKDERLQGYSIRMIEFLKSLLTGRLDSFEDALKLVSIVNSISV